MENAIADHLSEQTACSLLSIIAPGSELTSITVADGSFSNFTHVVEARLKDGNTYKVVVRRYKVFGNYDRGEKARREFKTFELLNRHQIPAPEAIYLDEKGDVLGIPGIVTRFVEGSLMMEAPSDPDDWAGKLARTLAKIHSIQCGEDELKFLLKGNTEVTWFLRYDAPPRYMQEYPGGSELWHMTRDLFPKIQMVPPVLLHIDYWSGNILWHKGMISAVDVAYARMNIVLMGLPDAADEFLRVYELETGHKVENLGFWELAASVRPMVDPVDWKVADGVGFDVFQRFITDTRKNS